MEPATLDRLMIDDALGALSPDVSALLAAHIRLLPGASEQMAAWNRVTQTAKEAMPAEQVESLPPLRWNASQQNSTHGNISPLRWQRRLISAAGTIAAAILLGISIGLFVPRKYPQSTVVITLPAPVGIRPIAIVPQDDNAGDFWSSKRLLAIAIENKHSLRSGPSGTAALIQSELGGPR
jgi:hypothetical protein